MADISVTAANVGMSTSKPRTARVLFGETVTEGKLVYLKSSDSKYYLAKADASATASIAGVVITPASSGEYGEIITSGVYDCGGTVVVGEPYFLSAANGGGFMATSGLVTGVIVSLFGFGHTTSTIDVGIKNTGLTHG